MPIGRGRGKITADNPMSLSIHFSIERTCEQTDDGKVLALVVELVQHLPPHTKHEPIQAAIIFMSRRPTHYTLQIHATFHSRPVYQCGYFSKPH